MDNGSISNIDLMTKLFEFLPKNILVITQKNINH
jgi:hypothetical protein